MCLCIMTIFILLQKYKPKAVMTSLKATFQDSETESEVCKAAVLIIGHLGGNF